MHPGEERNHTGGAFESRAGKKQESSISRELLD